MFVEIPYRRQSVALCHELLVLWALKPAQDESDASMWACYEAEMSQRKNFQKEKFSLMHLLSDLL